MNASSSSQARFALSLPRVSTTSESVGPKLSDGNLRKIALPLVEISDGSELNAAGRGCANRRSRDPDGVCALDALRGPNGREPALGKERCEWEKARMDVPVKSGGDRDETLVSGVSILSPRTLTLGLGFTTGGGDDVICRMSGCAVAVMVCSALRMRNLGVS
ncbi:hypothetical protein EI94DRAFT_1713377 [Lactarius quietus]|nr:hypothetical protein EI94DRAFT_1713377 [Lactarius quietus]